MRHFVLIAGFASLLGTPLAAQPDEAASVWSAGTHSAVRLIAGGKTADGAYRVGVEIRLKDGFKTYWRVPGDAGVPPSFDWAASDNAGSVSVRWPAPKRFVDLGITTIGYKDRVIFPVLIRPADGAKPTTLALKLDYAVCERICIPVKAEVSLKLPDAAETTQTASLNQFRAQIPRLKEPGKIDESPGLLSATFVPEKGRKAVDVAIAMPQGAALGEVFLEGPDGWLFGAPAMLQSDSEKILLRVPIDDRPKNVVGLVPLVLTVTGTPQSSEIRFDLEVTAPRP